MSGRPPDDDDDERRWTRGTEVRGVVPPGRRFVPGGPRPNRWSASGVSGVTPPGHASPSDSPSARWSKGQRSAKRARPPQRATEAKTALGATRSGGLALEIFADPEDPDHLGAFLEAVGALVAAHRPEDDCTEAFREVVHRSQAPFEIVVGFSVLSALVGKSATLRRRYAAALERGAKTFYNLGTRLDPSLKAPRGLAPESVDALFFDLPDLALEVPYAYAVQAFAGQIVLLGEGTPERDGALRDHAHGLWRRFVERRAYGDQALKDLFPWQEPFSDLPE